MINSSLPSLDYDDLLISIILYCESKEKGPSCHPDVTRIKNQIETFRYEKYLEERPNVEPYSIVD